MERRLNRKGYPFTDSPVSALEATYLGVCLLFSSVSLAPLAVLRLVAALSASLCLLNA